MSSISIPKDHLAKIADLVKATVPHLEKSANDDAQLEKAATDAAEQMVRLQLIRPENRPHVIKDIVDGRFSKLSEALQFIADHVGEPANQMGKSASESSPVLTSDDVWNTGFCLKA